MWRSTRLVTHTAANPMSGSVARRHWRQCRKKIKLRRNLAPAFCKAHITTLQVLVYCLEIQLVVPQSAQFSFPPIRVIFMSPFITKRCNHSVGIAMCLMRPAPLRIAMVRPAVASNLISKLGLSIPLPSPFALTSTPSCCKTTPRSRNIETLPIPAAAALTATTCVVEVDSSRCLP